MLIHFKQKNFWIVFSADTFLLCIAYFLAYCFRFDGQIPANEMETFMVSVVWIVPLKLGIYFFMGLYRGMWRYTSVSDVIKIFKANILALFNKRALFHQKSSHLNPPISRVADQSPSSPFQSHKH